MPVVALWLAGHRRVDVLRPWGVVCECRSGAEDEEKTAGGSELDEAVML